MPTPLISPIHPILNQSIPDTMGRIMQTYYADSGVKTPTVVFIQDAHVNYDAQKSISLLINEIVKNYGALPVAVEGAEGAIDTSLFRTFPIEEVKGYVFDRAMRQGLISGPEYASIVNKSAFELFGADDRNLYAKNMHRMLSIMEFQESGTKYVRMLKQTLSNLKAIIYNDEQRALDSLFSGFEEGKISFENFLDGFQKFAEKSALQKANRPNLNKVLEMYGKMKISNADSKMADAKGLLKEIRTEDLFEEISEAGREIRLNVARTKREKEFVEVSDFLSLLEQGLEFRLTREDAGFFRKYSRKYGGDRIHNLLLNALSDHKISQHSLSGEIATFDVSNLARQMMDFYRIAEKRDRIFVKSLLSKMESEGKDLGILVTGGYHREGVTKEFRKKGVSYVVVAPAMEKLEEHGNYLSLMKSYGRFLAQSGETRSGESDTLALPSNLPQNPMIPEAASRNVRTLLNELLKESGTIGYRPYDSAEGLIQAWSSAPSVALRPVGPNEVFALTQSGQVSILDRLGSRQATLNSLLDELDQEGVRFGLAHDIAPNKAYARYLADRESLDTALPKKVTAEITAEAKATVPAGFGSTRDYAAELRSIGIGVAIGIAGMACPGCGILGQLQKSTRQEMLSTLISAEEYFERFQVLSQKASLTELIAGLRPFWDESQPLPPAPKAISADEFFAWQQMILESQVFQDWAKSLDALKDYVDDLKRQLGIAGHPTEINVDVFYELQRRISESQALRDWVNATEALQDFVEKTRPTGFGSADNFRRLVSKALKVAMGGAVTVTAVLAPIARAQAEENERIRQLFIQNDLDLVFDETGALVTEGISKASPDTEHVVIQDGKQFYIWQPATEKVTVFKFVSSKNRRIPIKDFHVTNEALIIEMWQRSNVKTYAIPFDEDLTDSLKQFPYGTPNKVFEDQSVNDQSTNVIPGPEVAPSQDFSSLDITAIDGDYVIASHVTFASEGSSSEIIELVGRLHLSLSIDPRVRLIPPTRHLWAGGGYYFTALREIGPTRNIQQYVPFIFGLDILNGAEHLDKVDVKMEFIDDQGNRGVVYLKDLAAGKNIISLDRAILDRIAAQGVDLTRVQNSLVVVETPYDPDGEVFEIEIALRHQQDFDLNYDANGALITEGISKTSPDTEHSVIQDGRQFYVVEWVTGTVTVIGIRTPIEVLDFRVTNEALEVRLNYQRAGYENVLKRSVFDTHTHSDLLDGGTSRHLHFTDQRVNDQSSNVIPGPALQPSTERIAADITRLPIIQDGNVSHVTFDDQSLGGNSTSSLVGTERGVELHISLDPSTDIGIRNRFAGGGQQFWQNWPNGIDIAEEGEFVVGLDIVNGLEHLSAGRVKVKLEFNDANDNRGVRYIEGFRAGENIVVFAQEDLDILAAQGVDIHNIRSIFVVLETSYNPSGSPMEVTIAVNHVPLSNTVFQVSTIEEFLNAVTKARMGDTIQLAAGEYSLPASNSSLEFPSNVNILGAGMDLTKISGLWSLTGNRLTISNLTLRNISPLVMILFGNDLRFDYVHLIGIGNDRPGSPISIGGDRIEIIDSKVTGSYFSLFGSDNRVTRTIIDPMDEGLHMEGIEVLGDRNILDHVTISVTTSQSIATSEAKAVYVNGLDNLIRNSIVQVLGFRYSVAIVSVRPLRPDDYEYIPTKLENTLIHYDFSLFGGEQIVTQNVIFGDPLFVDYGNGDFHIQPDSPAIAAGSDGTDLGAIPFDRPPLPEGAIPAPSNRSYFFLEKQEKIQTNQGVYIRTTLKLGNTLTGGIIRDLVAVSQGPDVASSVLGIRDVNPRGTHVFYATENLTFPAGYRDFTINVQGIVNPLDNLTVSERLGHASTTEWDLTDIFFYPSNPGILVDQGFIRTTTTYSDGTTFAKRYYLTIPPSQPTIGFEYLEVIQQGTGIKLDEIVPSEKWLYLHTFHDELFGNRISIYDYDALNTRGVTKIYETNIGGQSEGEFTFVDAVQNASAGPVVSVGFRNEFTVESVIFQTTSGRQLRWLDQAIIAVRYEGNFGIFTVVNSAGEQTQRTVNLTDLTEGGFGVEQAPEAKKISQELSPADLMRLDAMSELMAEDLLDVAKMSDRPEIIKLVSEVLRATNDVGQALEAIEIQKQQLLGGISDMDAGTFRSVVISGESGLSLFKRGFAENKAGLSALIGQTLDYVVVFLDNLTEVQLNSAKEELEKLLPRRETIVLINPDAKTINELTQISYAQLIGQVTEIMDHTMNPWTILSLQGNTELEQILYNLTLLDKVRNAIQVAA